jgi:type VII secretion-associated serine protease mycosin
MEFGMWRLRFRRVGGAAAAIAVLAGSLALGVSPARAQVGACADSSLSRTGEFTGVPWAQQLLDPQRVWQLTDGAGVLVGVVDSGIDAANPALSAPGQVKDGGDVVAGGGSALLDCADHGTAVAGIIGGRPVPGSGFVGLAPGVTILSVKVAQQARDVDLGAVATGIRAAVDQGALVVNVSIESQAPDPRLEDAVSYAAQHNVVIVAAAGNENNDNIVTGNPKIYPASYDTTYANVLAVGAIDSTGQRGTFSETATPISVVAPGTEVVAPGAGGTGAGSLLAENGTSFAAPFVAATAALVEAYYKAAHGVWPSAAEVVHRIEATADRPAGSLPDSSYGWGTVDPYAAVTEVVPASAGGPEHTMLAVPAATAAPADHSAQIAGLSAAGAGIVVVLTAGFAVLRPLGRRRSWRPGTW